MTVAAPIVSIRDLVKEYRRGAEVVRVLDGLSLDIETGEVSTAGRPRTGERATGLAPGRW